MNCKRIVIFNNNQGAGKLAENPIFRGRTKHIAIKYHYIRELEYNEIKINI